MNGILARMPCGHVSLQLLGLGILHQTIAAIGMCAGWLRMKEKLRVRIDYPNTIASMDVSSMI